MYKKQSMFFMSILVLFSAFFFGCNEDKFEAGINLVPDSLKLKSFATDTFKIEAYTYKVDTLITGNISKVLVGKYTDPILGLMKASFVTQLIPSITRIDSLIKEGTVVDSLVLYLHFSVSGLRAYGDSATDCVIDIMRVNKFLDFNDTYYYNLDAAELNATLLKTVSFNPKQIIKNAEDEADSIYNALFNAELADTAGGVLPDTADIVRPTPIALLSIKFPDELRDEIFSLIEPSIHGGVTFAEAFGGLYITPNPTSSSNSISIFDYTSDKTNAVLYYETKYNSLEYQLALTDYNTRFNLFEHNYNAAGFLPDLDKPESKQDSVVYVHGAAGLRTKIIFPNIGELKKQGKYAVNRAELILTAESSALTLEDIYPAPLNLILTRIDDGSEFGLQEYSNPAGGSYTSVEYIDGKYIFDITLYIQKVLDGELNNHGLMVRLPDEKTNPSRVVLTSPSHSNRMKLVLTLTKLSD